jgi:dipeptide/tripeptide permease
LSIIDRIDQYHTNLINRDFTYISYAIAVAIIAIVIGIMAGIVLEPVLGGHGDGFGIGFCIAVAGAFFGFCIFLIYALKLFIDTWKIEATPELREEYGKSIKWTILFFFLISPSLLWLLLLIGHFAYQSRYDTYIAHRAKMC